MSSAKAALRLLALAVAVAAGATLTADRPVSSQTAEQAKSRAAADEFWHPHARYVELQNWIVTQPGYEASGYIELVDDPDADPTILYWHGPADRLQRQIKDRARGLGLTIAVRQRRHSRAQLDRAVTELRRQTGRAPFTNFQINIVTGTDPDFDGITVDGQYLHPVTGDQAEALAALARAASARYGIPVDVRIRVTLPL